MPGFGGSAFFGDVLGGFNRTIDQQRQENIRQGEIQAARDQHIFDLLANSDDDDVRAAAVTGLLTGNHPARAFDKFMGKTQEHPAYQQIKALVGQGHQPFLSPTDRLAKEASAGLQGKMTGIQTAYKTWTGQDATPEMTSHWADSLLGGATKASAPYSTNYIYRRPDGTTGTVPARVINGVAYHTQTSQPIDEWANDNGVELTGEQKSGAMFSPRGAAGLGRGFGYETDVASFLKRFPEAANDPQFQGVAADRGVRYQLDTQGHLMPGQYAVKPTPALTITPVPTAKGWFGVPTHGPGTVAGPIPELAGQQPGEQPTAYADRLDRLHQSIISQAEVELKKPFDIKTTDENERRAKWDEIARRNGYQGMSDLEAQMKAARDKVGGATRQPQGPPAAPGAPNVTGAGAAGTAAPAGAAGATEIPPGTGAAAPKSDDELIDEAIRKMLLRRSGQQPAQPQ